MIKNFKKQSRIDDLKCLAGVLIIFLFVAWLCTPPGNKFAQVCLWGNKTQYFIAKLMNKSEIKVYAYHHKNAIYLAKMNQKNESLAEIDRAIESYPTYMPDDVLYSMYADRAEIKLYFGEQHGALEDLLRIKQRNMLQNFKVAMLLKEHGKTNVALNVCKEILKNEPKAYAGYACYADLYANSGNYDNSLKIMDYLIFKNPERPTYYLDRAYYRALAGDSAGALLDENKAKELLPSAEPLKAITIVEDSINPKIIIAKTKC